MSSRGLAAAACLGFLGVVGACQSSHKSGGGAGSGGSGGGVGHPAEVDDAGRDVGGTGGSTISGSPDGPNARATGGAGVPPPLPDASTPTGGAAGASPDAGSASDASAAGTGGAAVPVDAAAVAGAPSGLLVELTAHPEGAAISDKTPEFAWIVGAPGTNQRQSAYQILVASTAQNLEVGTGDLWDSGKTMSEASVDVPYAGKALAAGATYLWKVRTWAGSDAASPWSAAQSFKMAANLNQYSTSTPPVVQTPVAPAAVTAVGTGHSFIDFGRAAFGWAELTVDAPSAGTVVTVNLGEKAKGQAVDLNPGGTIRSAQIKVTLQQGMHTYRLSPPKDSVNTSSPAIPLPAALGVVMPFRYLEISNSPVTVTAASVRQIAVAYPFDDTAAAFTSSNTTLNQVWGLSKYSIIATTFANLYIDGDRERTPYEADAYIQQLGHYAIDRDYALARRSHEYLMVNPTWPTEWKSHSVMMAWADWMYTGNTESLAQQYASLKKDKTLESYVGSDGLLNTNGLRDIVDWPAAERDGYVLTDVNTVVNAFWCHVLGQMGDIAEALGNTADATRYRNMATTAITALNSKLFDTSTGLYVDGGTSKHSSLHANMFPLAFGLVPADRQAAVTTFVKSRGMACSVYGAQYLLEALFETGQADAALALLTATGDRGWKNMLNVGSTMTMEAWDAKYKSNLDWNHAWGAAPANIIPRYVLGVRPLTPGFATAAIQPQPGALAHVEGTVATIRGPVRVSVDTAPLAVTVVLPANMTANVALPTASGAACTPSLDGAAAATMVMNGKTWVKAVGSGQHTIRCR